VYYYIGTLLFFDNFIIKSERYTLVLLIHSPISAVRSRMTSCPLKVFFKIHKQQGRMPFFSTFFSNNSVSLFCYDSGLGSKKQYVTITGSIMLPTSARHLLRKSAAKGRRWFPFRLKQRSWVMIVGGVFITTKRINLLLKEENDILVIRSTSMNTA
jgi:hypothetical protein